MTATSTRLAVPYPNTSGDIDDIPTSLTAFVAALEARTAIFVESGTEPAHLHGQWWLNTNTQTLSYDDGTDWYVVLDNGPRSTYSPGTGNVMGGSVTGTYRHVGAELDIAINITAGQVVTAGALVTVGLPPGISTPTRAFVQALTAFNSGTGVPVKAWCQASSGILINPLSGNFGSAASVAGITIAGRIETA